MGDDVQHSGRCLDVT